MPWFNAVDVVLGVDALQIIMACSVQIGDLGGIAGHQRLDGAGHVALHDDVHPLALDVDAGQLVTISLTWTMTMSPCRQWPR
jgi:hypothetical protein